MLNISKNDVRVCSMRNQVNLAMDSILLDVQCPVLFPDDYYRPLTSDKNWGLTLVISKENRSKQRIFFGVKVRQTLEKSLSLSSDTGLYCP